MEDKFIKLTSAVYRLLDFFPEGEPLKNRAKDKALAITEGLVSLKTCLPAGRDKVASQLLEDIEILLNYLKLAKSFGWIDGINFLIISKEYENIKKQIYPERQMEKIVFKEVNPPVNVVAQTQEVTLLADEFLVSERQKKILQILNEKGKAQVSDFKVVLGNITKRTIRRDLDELLKNSKIIRTGEWNQVFYEIK